MKKILALIILCILIFNSIFISNSENVLFDNTHECCYSTVTPTIDTNTLLSQRTISQLPSSVDLSEDYYLPCVRDQGFVNSCVAWACTYYQFGYQVARMKNWNAKYDDTKQFSPKWTFNILSNAFNSGIDFDDVYKLLSTQGAVRYSEFAPLSDNTTLEYREWLTQTSLLKEALRYRVSDYYCFSFADKNLDTPITSPDSSVLDNMKTYLNTGHILTCAIGCNSLEVSNLENQYNSALNGQSVITMHTRNGNNYHAIAIVGYDDNIEYDINNDGIIQEGEKGAFKLVDSSGSDYWSNGYVWVMYDALNKVSSIDSNIDGHYRFIEDNAYYVIEVEERELELLANVTLSCSTRSSVSLQLGESDIDELEPNNISITLFNDSAGGKFNFSGTGLSEETATFVFDFGNVITYPEQWKKYYISFTNRSLSYDATIENIELADGIGRTIWNDENEKTLLNSSDMYSYTIAMVADVNNDALINALDVTMIQKYLAKIITLTEQEKLVADVTGDNKVTILDATYINNYILGTLEEFSVGKLVYVG